MRGRGPDLTEAEGSRSSPSGERDVRDVTSVTGVTLLGPDIKLAVTPHPPPGKHNHCVREAEMRYISSLVRVVTLASRSSGRQGRAKRAHRRRRLQPPRMSSHHGSTSNDRLARNSKLTKSKYEGISAAEFKLSPLPVGRSGEGRQNSALTGQVRPEPPADKLPTRLDHQLPTGKEIDGDRGKERGHISSLLNVVILASRSDGRMKRKKRAHRPIPLCPPGG